LVNPFFVIHLKIYKFTSNTMHRKMCIAHIFLCIF